MTNLLLKHLPRLAPAMRRLMFFIAFASFPLLSRAANLTLQGNFTADDNIQFFSVSIAAPATIDIRSYGYAGGTTSTGTVVPRGGFDTILTLFGASGAFINDNDDGAGVAIDPQTGQASDARITANLGAGNYIVALTQYDNFSIGNLADGFAETGHPNFTADPGFANGGACPGNMFRDISGTAGRCRTGGWTVDFLNVSSVAPVAVPEPSALLLAGLGLGLLLVSRFRHWGKSTVLACAFVAAFAGLPLQAQTSGSGNCKPVTSGPDYCPVPDFLNGERTLLNITDLQVFRQSKDRYNIDDGGQFVNLSNNIEAIQIATTNSQQSPETPIIYNSDSGSWYADSAKPMLSLSAFMFNQQGASTLTTMGDFQHGGKFALWLQNVSGLQGAPGWWSPLSDPNDPNPNPNVTSGVVADFTLDGYDDLALGFDDGRLLVLTPKDVNDVFANFNDSITNFDVLKAMAAGDFNGDGRREIAGLNVTSEGALQLEIYTVDPSSLTTTKATSFALTMPQGVSASNPITYMSMARGRFNSAGHDQLVVAFATNGGFPIVEIVDFAVNTLNPVERPQLTETTANIPVGFLEVKTGQFTLPNNPNDEIVFHLSSTSGNGKFFEIMSADPTKLELTTHSGVTYNQYPCAAGIQVGNFDHRNADKSHNPNAQVALMYCSGSPFVNYPQNQYNGYTLNIYSADATTLNLNTNPDSINSFGQDIWTNPQADSSNVVTLTFTSTDLEGRSLTLGEPTKISIDSATQPSVVVGVPPMHVDFIDPGDGNGPRVFNVSVVPDGFKTTYNQENSSSYASNNTNTTSWSFGAKETISAGFTIGDPDADFLKISDTFTAAQNLEKSHELDHGTYNGKSFNISATTGFGDEVTYTDPQFNIWVYPVIGRTVCPAAPASCNTPAPLTIQFSAPGGDSQSEAVQGQGLQWYQPPWEPGNIFSYPANLDQLKVHYPNLSVLTNDATGFLTDGSTLTQTATWTGSGEDSNSAGLTQNYSYDNDFSVNGAFEFAGIGAEGSVGLDISGSAGFSSLVKSTTTLGKSTGVQISKPGTFPAFQNYGYSVKPYIIGSMQPGGLVDNQPLSTDIQTVGVLRTVFTADPLSQDPPAGGWWLQAYTAAPDVALSHPSRWTYSTQNQPNSGDPPPSCLLTGDGKSMDCAELSQRSPNNPWLDIFHNMRGFFISSGGSPGQGPQLDQAKAGDVLTLQTRVYNYSLAAMPNNTDVHVRFYFTRWNHGNNLPLDSTGYLINEETVGAIPPFNESSGPNALPNWTLVSTTFDTSKFAAIQNGGEYLVFWVVVWMQDANGNLVGEMPGHGLTGIPGTLASLADAAKLEECQPDGNCYSNNVGLFKQQFYLVSNLPMALPPGPPSTSVSLDIGKLDVSAYQITRRSTVVLSAMLSANGAAASGVGVNFYDGDPNQGGRLLAVERVPYMAANSEHLVQTTYKTNGCGVHQLFAVINRGRPSEIVRRTHSVRVACDAF